MSASIVIVADDFTGAADCGITCTAEGLVTLVVFGEISRAPCLDADAIAFDADTRHQLPEASRANTELAIRRLCAGGSVRVLYKKIDSTLRGNFAVEIAAALRSNGGLLAHGGVGDGRTPASPVAIIAPAFPATGRTTRSGECFFRANRSKKVRSGETKRGRRGRGLRCGNRVRPGTPQTLVRCRAALRRFLSFTSSASDKLPL